MSALAKKIERVVRTHLRDGRAVALEPISDRKLTGHIISSEFRRKTMSQRRRRLDKVLEQHLSERDRRGIEILFPYTPEEYDVPLEI